MKEINLIVIESLFCGILFYIDLMLNLNPTTNFYNDNLTLVRYALIIIMLIVVFFQIKKIQIPKTDTQIIFNNPTYKVISAIFCIILILFSSINIFFSFNNLNATVGFLIALGFLVGSLYFLKINSKNYIIFFSGVIFIISYILLILKEFAISAYSIYYIEPCLKILCITIPLVFIVKLFNLTNTSATEKNVNKLIFYGVITFFTTISIYLPMQVRIFFMEGFYILILLEIIFVVNIAFYSISVAYLLLQQKSEGIV